MCVIGFVVVVVCVVTGFVVVVVCVFLSWGKSLCVWLCVLVFRGIKNGSMR